MAHIEISTDGRTVEATWGRRDGMWCAKIPGHLDEFTQAHLRYAHITKRDGSSKTMEITGFVDETRYGTYLSVCKPSQQIREERVTAARIAEEDWDSRRDGAAACRMDDAVRHDGEPAGYSACDNCGRRANLQSAHDMSGIPCSVCRSCAAEPECISVA